MLLLSWNNKGIPSPSVFIANNREKKPLLPLVQLQCFTWCSKQMMTLSPLYSWFGETIDGEVRKGTADQSLPTPMVLDISSDVGSWWLYRPEWNYASSIVEGPPLTWDYWRPASNQQWYNFLFVVEIAISGSTVYFDLILFVAEWIRCFHDFAICIWWRLCDDYSLEYVYLVFTFRLDVAIKHVSKLCNIRVGAS